MLAGGALDGAANCLYPVGGHVAQELEREVDALWTHGPQPADPGGPELPHHAGQRTLCAVRQLNRHERAHRLPQRAALLGPVYCCTAWPTPPLAAIASPVTAIASGDARNATT